MELNEPKQKRRVQVTPQEPFPIPIETFTEVPAWKCVWQIYTGKYNGDSVIVDSPEEMNTLYNMGFFGKGSLSRSAPVFGKLGDKVPPLIYNRQWKRRCMWAEQRRMAIKPDPESTSMSTGKEDARDTSKSNIPSATYNSIPGVKRESPANKALEKCFNASKTNLNSENCELKIDDEINLNKVKPELVDLEDDDVVMLSSDDDDCITLDKDQSNDVKQAIEVLSVENDSVSGESSSESSEEQQSSDAGDKSVIVLADSDCDVESEHYLLNLKPRLEQDVFRIRETLHLTLEESFFLSYGLGCLQVIDLFGNGLSLEQMWKLFCDSQRDFIQKYVVYHYFRAKGWVVKPGIRFGGDFLLYKQGPPFYHASYIVLIEVVLEDTLSFSEVHSQQPLTWTKFIGLNRLAETAGKEVLLCRVVWPCNIPPHGLYTPKVLSKFTVQEVLMRRWVSSQERGDKDEEEISE